MREINIDLAIPRSYRYSFLLIYFYLFINIVVFSFILLMIIYFYMDKYYLGIILVSFCGMPSIFLLRGLLSRITLSLDETHIKASIFGITTKKVEWKEISKIRKTCVYNGYNSTETFRIFEKSHNILCRFFLNICGDIAFTQDIYGLRDLLDRINYYAQRHKIPLAVVDPRMTPAERAKDMPLGGSQQGMVRNTEVRVGEF